MELRRMRLLHGKLAFHLATAAVQSESSHSLGRLSHFENGDVASNAITKFRRKNREKWSWRYQFSITSSNIYRSLRPLGGNDKIHSLIIS